ncbi:unnamed protein product, partial [Pylaiella littoralis]
MMKRCQHPHPHPHRRHWLQSPRTAMDTPTTSNGVSAVASVASTTTGGGLPQDQQQPQQQQQLGSSRSGGGSGAASGDSGSSSSSTKEKDHVVKRIFEYIEDSVRVTAQDEKKKTHSMEATHDSVYDAKTRLDAAIASK